MGAETKKDLRPVAHFGLSAETWGWLSQNKGCSSFLLSFSGILTTASVFSLSSEDESAFAFWRVSKCLLIGLLTLLYAPMHLVSHLLSALPVLGDVFLALFRPWHAFQYHAHLLRKEAGLLNKTYAGLMMALSVLLPSGLFAGIGYLCATDSIVRTLGTALCQGDWQSLAQHGPVVCVLAGLVVSGLLINYGLQCAHGLSRAVKGRDASLREEERTRITQNEGQSGRSEAGFECSRASSVCSR